ncbi:MAG: pyridoxal-phosphate dependent enzyme [Candidatus Dormibacteraeota bacterium]|uniref:Pyridoxal-phosphate dependent enzyme n=1 Tax=Candidatus Dormiibacter inghamiae TaxID=3127013 RepID=A0A934KGA1_9BACT|nr:pyridoxal-phosphate dependent enzyme [Candidatus Dormibacteraeota bacterium]MBJ7606402.1 pyridoxal-phosphate dependent enzyme [Candidatus Dormibacteraeota bacterium]
MNDLQTIGAAVAAAQPYVRRTPLLPLDRGRWLKLESLQPTGSFKVRGFLAAALALSPDERARGLLTVSAGNAALACAYAAHALDVPCRVFSFDTAPKTKLEGLRALGAGVTLLPRADLLAWLSRHGWEAEPETFIHPFADDLVQAGHGGIGLEILADVPGVHRVVVPVGGGGLMVGVAEAIKQTRPAVEMVGAVAAGYEMWPRIMRGESLAATLKPETIADGTTAPYDSRLQPRLAACVDSWVTVPEPVLRGSVWRLAAEGKVVAEGAGALAYAALDFLESRPPTVAVVSGGNIDPALLVQLNAESL